jgi:hypothetical protein
MSALEEITRIKSAGLRKTPYPRADATLSFRLIDQAPYRQGEAGGGER